MADVAEDGGEVGGALGVVGLDGLEIGEGGLVGLEGVLDVGAGVGVDEDVAAAEAGPGEQLGLGGCVLDLASGEGFGGVFEDLDGFGPLAGIGADEFVGLGDLLGCGFEGGGGSGGLLGIFGILHARFALKLEKRAGALAAVAEKANSSLRDVFG